MLIVFPKPHGRGCEAQELYSRVGSGVRPGSEKCEAFLDTSGPMGRLFLTLIGKERRVNFQTLLNCHHGVGTQDGVLVVATANDSTCLDAAILKRPGRFDRVVQFRNPDADLRREYYRRPGPILDGEKFEKAIYRRDS
jgi:SpoVK/Ycf46/Vps4 family AAA+-type ATPase